MLGRKSFLLLSKNPMHSRHWDTEIKERNKNICPHRFQITLGNDSLSLITIQYGDM